MKNSRVLKNSIWGIGGSGVQTLLLSLFFVILARKYETSVFSIFLIATTIYQFLSAFSTLGLSQWFTRAIVNAEDKPAIINKFLKVQLFSGIFFYIINIIVAYTFYESPLLRQLALILGINILFDNIIYGIRALNVAEFQQKKSFVILLVDAILKFLASCILLFYPLPIILLATILIGIRLITVNAFLAFGSGKLISLGKLIVHKISWKELRNLVMSNWAFVVIGSVSMIYWRIGNLIISKTLPLKDVANYEVSYRVFSIALILPIIVSTTLFPSFVELYKSNNIQKLKSYFQNLFFLYLVYSLLVYTFFYSFSDFLIPFVFGEKFLDNAPYTKEMFLAVLVFPTVLLQANVLVALHKEKIDMWLNVLSLVVNVVVCVAGLFFIKSLTVVNIAIFVSFLVFHICQDIYLIKYKISTLRHVIGIYIFIASVVAAYIVLSKYLNPIVLFLLFWVLIFTALISTTIGISGIKKILQDPKSFTLLELNNRRRNISSTS